MRAFHFHTTGIDNLQISVITSQYHVYNYFIFRQKNQSQSVKIQYPMSLHGIGLAYMKLERYKEVHNLDFKTVNKQQSSH